MVNSTYNKILINLYISKDITEHEMLLVQFNDFLLTKDLKMVLVYFGQN